MRTDTRTIVRVSPPGTPRGPGALTGYLGAAGYDNLLPVQCTYRTSPGAAMNEEPFSVVTVIGKIF